MYNTTFTLQIGIGPTEVRMRSFKMFKISASKFCTMGMHRQIRACADEFLAMATEGEVHGVYKVVTRS